MIKEMIYNIKEKLFTREIITYLIAGVATTFVNIAIYNIFYVQWHIPNLLSNAIAWMVSVLFAYFVNDKFVFIQEKGTHKQEWYKFYKFILARLFSFGIDELGMFLLVDLVAFSGNLSKVIMNVIVVIINYIFSKKFIFQNNKMEEVSK